MKVMLTSAHVDRARLRQEAVQQVGILRRLHAYGEAQILGRLLGDQPDCGYRRTGMPQHHVLDVLRPDGGKSADARSDGRAAERSRTFQQRRRDTRVLLLPP